MGSAMHFHPPDWCVRVTPKLIEGSYWMAHWTGLMLRPNPHSENNAMSRGRLFVGLAVLLALVAVAARAQDQNQAGALPIISESEYLRATSNTAQKTYLNLAAVNAKSPGAISDEKLSAASLEWLKAEMRLVTTKEDAMRVTSEYLQREGRTVK